jgi:Response regulators consisting of a CheY-like receiver domain and a winged-helix DNA-binding domain
VLRRTSPSLRDKARGRPDRHRSGHPSRDRPRPLSEPAAKEYDLLAKLATEPERVFTKEQLLREVWGYLSLGGLERSTRMRHGFAGSSRRPEPAPASSTLGRS